MIPQRRISRPLSDLLETSGQTGFRIGHARRRDAAVSVSLSSWTSPCRLMASDIVARANIRLRALRLPALRCVESRPVLDNQGLVAQLVRARA